MVGEVVLVSQFAITQLKTNELRYQWTQCVPRFVQRMGQFLLLDHLTNLRDELRAALFRLEKLREFAQAREAHRRQIHVVAVQGCNKVLYGVRRNGRPVSLLAENTIRIIQLLR